MPDFSTIFTAAIIFDSLTEIYVDVVVLTRVVSIVSVTRVVVGTVVGTRDTWVVGWISIVVVGTSYHMLAR